MIPTPGPQDSALPAAKSPLEAALHCPRHLPLFPRGEPAYANFLETGHGTRD